MNTHAPKPAQNPPATQKALPTLAQVRDAILVYVDDRDWVSFAELPRALAEALGVDKAVFKGNLAIELPTPNLFVWANMSPLLCDAIQQLLREKKVFLHSSCRWTYLIDGECPTWPIAKRCPKSGFKKPHWVPACLRTVPIK